MRLEQRRAERKDMSIAVPVWIDRRDGSVWESCTLKDVSNGGAQLVLASADKPLPERFLLRLSLRDQSGKPCILRWQRGTLIGVQYVSMFDSAARSKQEPRDLITAGASDGTAGLQPSSC